MHAQAHLLLETDCIHPADAQYLSAALLARAAAARSGAGAFAAAALSRVDCGPVPGRRVATSVAAAAALCAAALLASLQLAAAFLPPALPTFSRPAAPGLRLTPAPATGRRPAEPSVGRLRMSGRAAPLLRPGHGRQDSSGGARGPPALGCTAVAASAAGPSAADAGLCAVRALGDLSRLALTRMVSRGGGGRGRERHELPASLAAWQAVGRRRLQQLRSAAAGPGSAAVGAATAVLREGWNRNRTAATLLKHMVVEAVRGGTEREERERE